MKTINTVCDWCSRGFYKRPSQKKKTTSNYCTFDCYRSAKVTRVQKSCEGIGCANLIECIPSEIERRRFCSKKCLGTKIGKHKGTKNYGYKNPTDALRLELPKVCEVMGCKYKRVLHMHRWPLAGKDGGKYKRGNVVMVCPNHHCEHHAGLVEFESGEGGLIATYSEGTGQRG